MPVRRILRSSPARSVCPQEPSTIHFLEKISPWQRMHHKMLPLSGKMQSERSSLLHYAGINPCGKRRCKRWSYFLRRQCRLSRSHRNSSGSHKNALRFCRIDFRCTKIPGDLFISGDFLYFCLIQNPVLSIRDCRLRPHSASSSSQRSF